MNPITKLAYKAYTYYKYKPSKMLRDAFKHFPEADQYPQPSENIKNKKILFCPFAPHQINMIREGVWAHACAQRGANVKMITYDLFLEAIDFVSPRIKKDLAVSYKISKQYFKIMKLPFISLSDHNTNPALPDVLKMKPKDIESLHHLDIKIGDLIIASTIRYFYCNGPEWENPEFLAKARQFAYSALVLTEIYEHMLNQEKPDKIVTSHGIYVSWGTLFRLARKKQISVDVYGASYRKNTLRFYHNEPNAPFPTGHWNDVKNIELNKIELKIVDDYFASRVTQSEDGVTLFRDNDNFPDDLNDFIKDSQKANKKLFCLFTNISWDAYMFSNSADAFQSMTEWLEQNIEYFKTHPEASLIIKAHPAERYFVVDKKYCVKSFIPTNLPSNIYFIDNDRDVKPFDLYPSIEIGLIYLSTVSLEMALNNIPVLTAGIGGQYSDKGFTIDPSTKSEYFTILDKLLNNKLQFKPDICMAKRYLYFRFFREALLFDVLNVEKYMATEIKINSSEDLAPGKNKTLDIICEGILNDKDFIN